MKHLTSQQLQQVHGGFWVPVFRFVLPVIVNAIVYTVNKIHHHEEPTPTGFAIATGTGMITGGIGAATNIATASTLAGAAAWAPGLVGLNASGNLIAQEY